MKNGEIFTGLLLLLLLSACNPYNRGGGEGTQAPVLTRRPTNIILMIGDGMGLSQITAGMYRNDNRLQLERFPVVGLQKSYSADDLITDSAAGATAFACGIKTNNGAVGVTTDNQPARSILEEAEARGKATGLVTTSSIVHATPAAFVAHVKSRKMYEAIAAAFLETEVDFFVGGGQQYFLQRQSDRRNLYAELQEKGYYVSDYLREALPAVTIDFERNFAYFTAKTDPLPVAQGRTYFLPACQLAPIFLTRHSDRGFFLMIESAQIDWGGHANDPEYIISEMIEFDQAIGAVLDFAEEDGETLVIVTADHETGGLSINPGSSMDTIAAAFTTDKHTGALVPVFAFGPGAELFGGIYENTAVYYKMMRAWGYEPAAMR